MRRSILPLSLVLALATGLVLAELCLAFVTPPEPGTANAAAVRHFYDAVNHALLTGDMAALDPLLAADFVDHAAIPGQTGNRTGLTHYLRALHRATPALVVTGHDLVAEGDRVSARVRVEEVGNEPATRFPPTAGRAWGTLDLFRLRDGRIVEHWGDDTGLVVTEPILEIPVPAQPYAQTWVEAGWLTYPSSGADRRWTSGPTVLLVEAGDLTVALDPISPLATVVPAAAARRALAAGETVVLAAGDAVMLASGSSFEVRNGGSSPTTALVVWFGEPAFPLRAGTAHIAPGTASAKASYAALAGGMSIRLPEGAATIAVGRVAMAPGATVANHLVTHAEFAIVEAGHLALSVQGGQAWLRRGSEDASRAVTGGTALPGDGLAFEAGATIGYAPDGDEPLVALVIAIGPALDGEQPLS